jgi:hypothetical protein
MMHSKNHGQITVREKNTLLDTQMHCFLASDFYTVVSICWIKVVSGVWRRGGEAVRWIVLTVDELVPGAFGGGAWGAGVESVFPEICWVGLDGVVDARAEGCWGVEWLVGGLWER